MLGGGSSPFALSVRSHVEGLTRNFYGKGEKERWEREVRERRRGVRNRARWTEKEWRNFGEMSEEEEEKMEKPEKQGSEERDESREAKEETIATTPTMEEEEEGNEDDEDGSEGMLKGGNE